MSLPSATSSPQRELCRDIIWEGGKREKTVTMVPRPEVERGPGKRGWAAHPAVPAQEAEAGCKGEVRVSLR